MLQDFNIPASTNSVPDIAVCTNIINLQSNIQHTITGFAETYNRAATKAFNFQLCQKASEE
jgi:hypothetical protein